MAVLFRFTVGKGANNYEITMQKVGNKYKEISFKGVCNHVYIHTFTKAQYAACSHTNIYNHLSIKNLFKKNQTLTTMYYKLLHL